METLDQKINFFFKSSTDKPIGIDFSYLYLLRRDIFTSLGHDPDTMAGIDYQVLWPGVMGILAGIDLLGKYLEGDDIKTTASRRFKSYYQRYFDNKNDCEVIYQLRNSMLHSFGLYSFTLSKGIKNKEYFFSLEMRNDNNVVNSCPSNRYTINIIALCNAFEISIGRYLDDLKKDKTLKNNFEKMFPFYSRMYLDHKI